MLKVVECSWQLPAPGSPEDVELQKFCLMLTGGSALSINLKPRLLEMGFLSQHAEHWFNGLQSAVDGTAFGDVCFVC